MQSMWRGEAAEPTGTVVGPPPFTDGGPLLHCSAQGPKALARAVRWACGYQGFTTDGDAGAMSAVAERVTAAFSAAGRPRPELGVSCFFALGDGALERLRDVVGRYYGFADPVVREHTVAALTIASPEAIAETITNAAAAGFDEVHFLPTTTDPAEIDRLEAALAV
jgi:alkanesulfonate monooxygenase SsuD/methylene tetrahydromethanopterin reductase-like flavin-dependent oxidoreductase (luciferase family)